MIKGLGTDIVEIARFERAAPRFAERVLTAAELAIYQQQPQPLAYLAKRWAAKEAAAKALGTGIAQGVTFQDFHTSNDAAGRPQLRLSGRAAELAEALGVRCCHLALADEKHYAVATVILE